MDKNFELRLQLRAIQAIRSKLPSHMWDDLSSLIVEDRQKIEGHLKKTDADLDRTLFGLLDTFK
jgi:hypothetical protein